MPFFTSTSNGIRLVVRDINELTVNGTRYIDHYTFIDIPKNTDFISIRFPATGTSGEEMLDIKVNYNEKDPEKMLTFNYNSEVNITYPEAYTHTVSWPGLILQRKIHVILPEPPYNAGKFLSGLE
ncbi:MAG: hypothetical protein FWD13_07310, partial [Treponema sp.]|nr:hypothetical protein [Treponema sp.]